PAKKNQRNGNEQGGLIDGSQKRVEIQANVVAAGHKINAGAAANLLVVKILNGRKFKVGHYPLVARAAKIKTRSDDGLRGGYVLVERNYPWRGADERRDLIRNTAAKIPPLLFPCADSSFGPGLGVTVQGVVNAARHGAERIADQVSRAVQDGKFVAPVQQ